MSPASAGLRHFFARYVTRAAGVTDPRIEQAFATVPREIFAGPGPWSIAIPGRGYVETPDDDPAYLYQNTLIGLDPARGINIGEPSAHALWLDALDLREGETVLQVGTGSGYYTTLLAQLVGPAGQVHGFEIDPGLAARTARNMAALPRVQIHPRSGIADGLPKTDAIYVNAALTQPSWAWLDALRPGGRLVFPMHGARGFGGMLRIAKPQDGGPWPARFVSRAGFIPCIGPQDEAAGRRLAAAFAQGGWDQVRSFRIDSPADETCWFAGEGWWLSTAA